MSIQHFIGNQWLTGTGPQLRSINPSTGEVLGDFRSANEDMINTAVTEAGNAFKKWTQLNVEQRLNYLARFNTLVESHKKDLAVVISSETGKLLWDAETEVNALIGKLALSLKAYKERSKPQVQQTTNQTALTRYKAHGVLAVFGPFNFPVHLPNGHIIPALLAGNTIIFKPSELASLVGQKMIELWEESGIPKGVMNLIHGDGTTGSLLAGHKSINGVLFTGSVNTGIAISKQLAESPNKISALEMGGNNPIVVHQSKNIKAVVQHIILSAFISSGQRCTCARRLIIPKGNEGDKVIDLLIEQMKNIKIGMPFDEPQPFMGPVINKKSADEMLNTQNSLINKGAKPLMTMERHKRCPALLSPGLIEVTGIKTEDKEHFGPLLMLIRTKDFESAIEEANNTRYGLSASLFSDDEKLYNQFYLNINAGIINWNKQTTGASSALPFGGIGLSGNFRPAGFFASDFCSYPVASVNSHELNEIALLPPGLGGL